MRLYHFLELAKIIFFSQTIHCYLKYNQSNSFSCISINTCKTILTLPVTVHFTKIAKKCQISAIILPDPQACHPNRNKKLRKKIVFIFVLNVCKISQYFLTLHTFKNGAEHNVQSVYSRPWSDIFGACYIQLQCF